MYTVVPAELVEHQPHLPNRRLQTIKGGFAELWPDGSICRIIATDPTLYLDPHLAPGARWQQGCRAGGLYHHQHPPLN